LFNKVCQNLNDIQARQEGKVVMEFQIGSALIIMGGLGLIFGIGLAIASKIFFVHKDPRMEEIEAVLPGANCGACGAPGCSGFAAGVVEGKYSVSGCIVGGTGVAQQVAQIMGVEAEDLVPQVAVVRCSGDRDNSVDRAVYYGIKDCRAAVLIDNGAKGCIYGCLGLGNCERACPFEAIRMGENGLPVVDELLCTACGECVKACPRNIMELIPRNQKVFVACVSKDFGKAVKAVCKVGCIGCGLCANPKTTENEIITMDGKLPVIHYDKVRDPIKDLENAVAKCPTQSFGVRRENMDTKSPSERKVEKVAE
jgi:electron transport complex protein RnfB